MDTGAALGPPLGLPADRPAIMGILNTTPDSFSDGGRHFRLADALAHGRRLVDAGADILDIGGESTRPGAEPVSVAEELDRVLPVIEALADSGATISIDTRNPEVMRAAVAAGAAWINDISALSHSPDSLATAAGLGVPVVLMHALGDPRTMQDAPAYDDVVAEVRDYLAARIDVAVAAGIARDRLIADPGIGFGKTVAHNLELLARLDAFAGLGVPILVGLSRKSFIGRLSGATDAGERLGGSLAGALWCAAHGARVIRVHDVSETRQALQVWRAVDAARPADA
ncbi:dihydropteroate synthase [Oceanibacterium hippocampi]|nr:dihydropteroate synthase [Oceanibacterium hippocampi]